MQTGSSYGSHTEFCSAHCEHHIFMILTGYVGDLKFPFYCDFCKNNLPAETRNSNEKLHQHIVGAKHLKLKFELKMFKTKGADISDSPEPPDERQLTLIMDGGGSPRVCGS